MKTFHGVNHLIKEIKSKKTLIIQNLKKKLMEVALIAVETETKEIY